MLCNSHTPKTRLKTVYHQSISEAFLTPLRFFHLMKSHVPFKKTSNMENYRKSHRVILVDLESDFSPLAAMAGPEVVLSVALMSSYRAICLCSGYILFDLSRVPNKTKFYT